MLHTAQVLSLLRLALSKSAITFGFNYKAGDFTEAERVELAAGVAKGTLAVNVLSKDIVPVLNALAHIEIDGNVTMQADENMVSFRFNTECAEYSINVPCCTAKAKRIKSSSPLSIRGSFLKSNPSMYVSLFLYSHAIIAFTVLCSFSTVLWLTLICLAPLIRE